MINSKSLLLSILLIGLTPSFLHAILNPLTEKEKNRLREKISQQTVAELEVQLGSEIRFREKELIIDELGQRGTNEARSVLEKFINKMRLNLKKHRGKDPESGMLHARALVTLTRIKTGEHPDEYLDELERLLVEGDSWTQDAVAFEIGKVPSKKARDLLFKYENKPNIHPTVRIERLKLDYWDLDKEEFVRAILSSARQQVMKGDTHLVAERSLLGQRAMHEALSPSLLEGEIKNPTLNSQAYLKFLKDMHESLKVCEDRYFGRPGLSESSTLESSTLDSKRDNGVKNRAILTYGLVAVAIGAFVFGLVLIRKKRLVGSIILGVGIVAVAVVLIQRPAGRNAAAPETVEPKEPRFTRPEERGVDFSLFETSEVIRRLGESEDQIERRKAAKILGDRSIAGELKLTSEEKKAVDDVVTGYLEQAKATNADQRVEASQQVERMWSTAVPTLLENLSSKDAAKAEMAIKSLILMRNESVIKEIISIGKTTEDEYTRAMAIFALKKMKEQRKSLIPGRECLGESDSKALYDRLVVPALADLEKAN